MNCGAYKNKIIIQKNNVIQDDIGNNITSWDDYFTCYAYINGLSGTEYWEASRENAENTVNIITRYCSELAEITPQNYRIIFNNGIYDINYIDNIQFKNETIKFKAIQKVGDTI